MALVFRARNLLDGRVVALKVMRPRLAADPRLRAMFLKEARHQQALRQPHILPILECVDAEAAPYIVLPLLESGSLAARLVRGPKLPPAQCARWATQIANAVAFAHTRGIIHRDIKPTNVLLTDHGSVVLSDFGLARTLWNDELTDASQPRVEGTCAYLSPAAARGESEDTRADIYALGALMYEMLTGTPPYTGGTSDEVIKRILAGPPVPILTRNPDAPLPLVFVAENAMARDLRRRYAHIGHLVEDLARIGEQQPPLGPRGAALGLLTRLHLAARAFCHRATATPSRRRRFACAVGLAIVATLATAAWAWTHPPGRLRLVKTLTVPSVDWWPLATIATWHREDLNVLAAPANDRLLMLATGDSEVIRRRWLPEVERALFGTVIPSDLDGDGLDELLAEWRDHTRLHISAINYNAVELRRFSAQGAVRIDPLAPSTPRPDSHLRPRALTDLNGDGVSELLADIATGFALQPRGLICFDSASASVRWRLDTAGVVIDVACGDLDGDGRQEVIVGTDAVDNGATGTDGTTDAESYAYCVDSEGRLRWRIQTGGVYTHAHPIIPTHPTGAPRPAYVVVRGSPEFWAATNRLKAGVIRVEADGQVSATLPAYAGRASMAQVSRPTEDLRFLLGEGDGLVRLLDSHLRVLETRRLEAPPDPSLNSKVSVIPTGAADLDRDGTDEWTVLVRRAEWDGPLNPGYSDAPPTRIRTLRPRLVILDAHMEVTTEHVFAEAWDDEPPMEIRIGQLCGDARPEVLALGNHAYLLQFRRQWLDLIRPRFD